MTDKIATHPGDAQQLDTLRELWHEHIPLTRAMQVELSLHNGQCLVIAPLAPNSNHMNTGFGGSLATLATLAGWAQTWLVIEQPEKYHIMIARSDVRFTAPATGELHAIAKPPSAGEVAKFNAALIRKSRGAIYLDVNVFCNDLVVATFSGKFVAVEKSA